MAVPRANAVFVVGVHRVGRRRDAPRGTKAADQRAPLRERSGWQKAVVALANKNARILWAVMTRGEAFDANH